MLLVVLPSGIQTQQLYNLRCLLFTVSVFITCRTHGRVTIWILKNLWCVRVHKCSSFSNKHNGMAATKILSLLFTAPFSSYKDLPKVIFKGKKGSGPDWETERQTCTKSSKITKWQWRIDEGIVRTLAKAAGAVLGAEQCHKLHRCKIIRRHKLYRCRHTSLPQQARESVTERHKRRRYKTSWKFLTAQNYSYKSLKAMTTTLMEKSVFDRGFHWMHTEGESGTTFVTWSVFLKSPQR